MKTNITFTIVLSIVLTKVLCTVNPSRDTVGVHENPKTEINEPLDLWEWQLRGCKERRPLSQDYIVRSFLLLSALSFSLSLSPPPHSP